MHSIGTEKERKLHAMLKLYFESDKSFHEQRIKGYIADIKRDNRIIEIQTRSFDKLKNKLNAFLSDDFDVTVVYPIAKQKWLIWVDPDTGEAQKKRKSPKTGTVYDCFKELYKIREYLSFQNLKLVLAFCDMEEYKLLCGWSRDRKKGSERIERYPVSDFELITVSGDGYRMLVPEDLEDEFTSKDFQKAAKITLGCAQKAVNLLCKTGAIEKVGKTGRLNLYSRAM